jgi:membrane protein implicated in regulation of membrane protease activity
MLEWVREWAQWVLQWAAENPGSFLYTVLLVLSPFFVVSAYLSWKLAKHLDADQKKKKAQKRRLDNIKAALADEKQDGNDSKRQPVSSSSTKGRRPNKRD